jgi:hypothetical protein
MPMSSHSSRSLTALNALLSFAVRTRATSERIGDKIAVSKCTWL